MSEGQRFEAEDGPELQALLAINTWHQRAVESIGTALANAVPGIKVAFGDRSRPEDMAETELNEDQAQGFRMGLTVALTMFGQLPVQLDFNGSTEDLPEVDFDSLSDDHKAEIRLAMADAGLPLTNPDE